MRQRDRRAVACLVVLAILSFFLGTLAPPAYSLKLPGAFPGGATFAQAALEQDYPLAWWVMNRIVKRLELSEEQKTEIKAILEEELPAVVPLVKQLMDNRKAQMAATEDGIYDEEEVKAFAKEQAILIAGLIVIKERIRIETYAVLTPEQQDQIQEMVGNVEERLKEWLVK